MGQSIFLEGFGYIETEKVGEDLNSIKKFQNNCKYGNFQEAKQYMENMEKQSDLNLYLLIGLSASGENNQLQIFKYLYDRYILHDNFFKDIDINKTYNLPIVNSVICTLNRVNFIFNEVCRNGYIDIVKVLVENGHDPLFKHSPCGRCMFGIAIEYDQLQTVKYFVNAGYKPKYHDVYGSIRQT